MSQLNPYESPAEVADATAAQAAQFLEPKELPFRSADLLTRALLGLLIAQLIVTVIAVINFELSHYFTLEIERLSLQRDPLANEQQVESQLQQIHFSYRLGSYFSIVRVVFGLLLQLVAVITFLAWVFTVNSNLPALGFERIFKGWMAIVALLLPCLNVLLCFPVLHELAIGSDPRRLNPHGYRGRGFSLLVIGWWLFMVVTLLAWLSLAAALAEEGTRLSLPGLLRSQSIIAALQFVPLALTYFLVRNVWRDQQQRREKIVSGDTEYLEFTSPFGGAVQFSAIEPPATRC